MPSKRSLILSGVAVAAMASALAIPSWASSHREAPGISELPKVDGTDFYMFRSYEPGREEYVTFIANYQPLQNPYGAPSYFTLDPDAIYEIHIDNDGDAIEDLTFQFNFDNELANGTGFTVDAGGIDLPIALRAGGFVTEALDTDLGENEFYGLTLITGDRRSGTRQTITNSSDGSATFIKPLDNIGNKTLPDYASYARLFEYDIDIPGCSVPGRVFAGQREEAFAVNLGEVFDLVNLIPIEGDSAPGAGDGGGFPGGITQDRANDDLVGELNITSLAIEVPISCLTGTGNGVIGAWTTSSLPQAGIIDPLPTYEQGTLYGGAFVQQSRLSTPLVDELFIGLPDKNTFNASEPKDDVQFIDYVTNPTLPVILDGLFRPDVNATLGTSFTDIAPSNFPRQDLVAAVLTGIPTLNQMSTVTPSEMLRLNTTIPVTPAALQSTYGVAGDDLAGFPNGRRPGDDAVDLALRVVMGVLCYEVPINGVSTDLGLCTPADAPVGFVAFTDGAPISAAELQNEFPYLKDPIPGSPNN